MKQAKINTSRSRTNTPIPSREGISIPSKFFLFYSKFFLFLQNFYFKLCVFICRKDSKKKKEKNIIAKITITTVTTNPQHQAA